VTSHRTLEVSIRGMDCPECTQHVRDAISALPGVESVDVSLEAEKAVVRLDPGRASTPAIRAAVEGAGYAVQAPSTEWSEAPRGGRHAGYDSESGRANNRRAFPPKINA